MYNDGEPRSPCVAAQQAGGRRWAREARRHHHHGHHRDVHRLQLLCRGPVPSTERHPDVASPPTSDPATGLGESYRKCTLLGLPSVPRASAAHALGGARGGGGGTVAGT